MINERDYCIFSSTSNSRKVERIPVICNLIKEFWIKYRATVDRKAGFHSIIKILEAQASNDYRNGTGSAPDPFYWEEDRWYDKIIDLTEKADRYNQSLSLTSKDINDMAQVVRYFENYWKLHPALRLQQVFEAYNDLISAKLDNFEFTNVEFWKNVFVDEELKIATESLEYTKQSKKEFEEMGMSDYYDSYVTTREIFLNKLKKEYGIE
jgi:hypothetical protein